MGRCLPPRVYINYRAITSWKFINTLWSYNMKHFEFIKFLSDFQIKRFLIAWVMYDEIVTSFNLLQAVGPAENRCTGVLDPDRRWISTG